MHELEKALGHCREGRELRVDEYMMRYQPMHRSAVKTLAVRDDETVPLEVRAWSEY